MHDKLVMQAAGLLSRFPGVTIRNLHRSPHIAAIDLQISSLESIVPVISSASAADLKCEVLTYVKPPASGYSDLSLLVYRILSQNIAIDPEDLVPMEVFIIYLAESLKDTGVIDDGAANEIIGVVNDRIGHG